MKNEILIIGGRQKKNALSLNEWHAYEAGLILRYNFENNTLTKVFEYISPKYFLPSKNPSITFKSAFLDKKTLYACTQTEVLLINLKSFKITHRISHKWFNDVHHVIPNGKNSVYVANTGLDQVLLVDYSGNIIEQWNVADVDTWTRFDPEVDYRKIPTTKPHLVHPNYLFKNRNDLYVTRFIQRDAVSLNSTDNNRINIKNEKPHDGIVYKEKIYFTTVDGYIVRTCSRQNKVIDRLKIIDRNNQSPLGWYRGLHILNDQLAVIGISRIRATKFRENLSWIKHGFKKVGTYAMQPTSIFIVCIKTGKILQDINIEDEGINAIFSIV